MYERRTSKQNSCWNSSTNNLNMILPKLVITDIDGVWTDAGMYYDQEGNELKKFSTTDSAGVLFCKRLKIPVVIMTGENTNIVKQKAEKLKIDFLFQGVSDKLTTAKNLCKKLNIELSEVAFIGDDLNDLKLLREVGIPGAPMNASDYIKKEVYIVTNRKGGEGAFREFIETIIKNIKGADFDFLSLY